MCPPHAEIFTKNETVPSSLFLISRHAPSCTLCFMHHKLATVNGVKQLFHSLILSSSRLQLWNGSYITKFWTIIYFIRKFTCAAHSIFFSILWVKFKTWDTFTSFFSIQKLNFSDLASQLRNVLFELRKKSPRHTASSHSPINTVLSHRRVHYEASLQHRPPSQTVRLKKALMSTDPLRYSTRLLYAKLYEVRQRTHI